MSNVSAFVCLYNSHGLLYKLILRTNVINSIQKKFSLVYFIIITKCLFERMRLVLNIFLKLNARMVIKNVQNIIYSRCKWTQQKYVNSLVYYCYCSDHINLYLIVDQYNLNDNPEKKMKRIVGLHAIHSLNNINYTSNLYVFTCSQRLFSYAPHVKYVIGRPVTAHYSYNTPLKGWQILYYTHFN